MRLLFVCLGNICRSAAAQGIMEQLLATSMFNKEIEVDSAGTYGGHAGQLADPRMRRAAASRGINLTHRARRVRATDFYDFDLIIAMDHSNRDDLLRLAPTLDMAAKVHEMVEYIHNYPAYDYVPDPYYEGASGFELVLDMLEEGCTNLLNALTSESDQ